jgi:hypothetical protein
MSTSYGDVQDGSLHRELSLSSSFWKPPQPCQPFHYFEFCWSTSTKEKGLIPQQWDGSSYSFAAFPLFIRKVNRFWSRVCFAWCIFQCLQHLFFLPFVVLECFCFVFFETGSHYVAQVGLELMILLTQLPDFRWTPSHLVLNLCLCLLYPLFLITEWCFRPGFYPLENLEAGYYKECLRHQRPLGSTGSSELYVWVALVSFQDQVSVLEAPQKNLQVGRGVALR